MSPVVVGPGIDLNAPVTAFTFPTGPGVGEGIVLASAVPSGAIINVPKTIVETIIAENFYYEHIQSAPAAEWTINHNLGKRPNISVYDSEGDEVLVAVEHTDVNTAHIYWPAPTTGAAYCS